MRAFSTIKGVTEDIENLKYNTAIAKTRILFNYINKANVKNKEVLEIFVKLISVFTPHLAEELSLMIDNDESIFKSKWPVYNQAKIKEENYEMIVQINGKIRGKMEMDINSSKEVMEEKALELDNVKKHLENKKIIKTIIIEKKLVNIVVK